MISKLLVELSELLITNAQQYQDYMPILIPLLVEVLVWNW